MSDRPHPLALFDTDELARLSERARADAQGGVKGTPVKKGVKLDPDEEEAILERDRARVARGLTGLRVASMCWALRRDPRGLTPIVWGAWAVRRDVSGCSDIQPYERIVTAVLRTGPRLFEVPGLVERLARTDLACVRRALARALPEGAESEPILRALGRDADSEVREAAQARIGPPDRWGGAFPIDPEGPIDPESDRDAALEEARAVLDQTRFERKKDPERAVAAFAPLSDALAVACWERVLSAEGVRRETAQPWLTQLIEREGGGAALARLVALWDRRGTVTYDATALDGIEDRVPDASRARAFAELLEALDATEAAEWGTRERPYLRAHLAEVAVALRPPADRIEARRLLETILGGPIDEADAGPDGYDRASSLLSELLVPHARDAALAPLQMRARRDGTPGRWERVGRAVWEALGPDPVLRERFFRDLDAADAGARSVPAAVRALLGEHHDEAEDGPREALARRLYARPALRAAVIGAAKELLPDARADLAAGRLDLDAAIAVWCAIERHEPTEAEWTALQALRDAAMREGGEQRTMALSRVETLTRPGVPDPSDLAFLRAAAEDAFTKTPARLRLLIHPLERCEGPEAEALLAEIEERASADETLRAHLEAGRELGKSLRLLARR